ncbi:MAG: protein kinase [Bacteroidetes bacterium]|jgi:hypothetical protein|nr:protein kinase [Bacteroidota bacterium]
MTHDPLIGQEVDGYRILEVLGRGGMGVVYRAENLSLGRMEALKVIAPTLLQDARFVQRFQVEARTLAQIHHPNIVTVFAQRHTDVGLYLTMEYVQGHTLADVLVERGALPWPEVYPIAQQLLGAFAYAHTRGIIHRDIKPRNVMLTPEGQVKVMDFGLAKFYQQHDATQTQGVAGTLYYMSPEQIKGSTTLDQRSDIFSLGMTLYEMLSGRLPFDKSGSQYTIQRSIVEGNLPGPNRFNTDVPRRLSAIVMQALQTDVDARYQQTEDLLEALATYEHERTLTEMPPDTSSGRTLPPRQVRRRWPYAVLASTALAGLVIAGMLWRGSASDKRPSAAPAAAPALAVERELSIGLAVQDLLAEAADLDLIDEAHEAVASPAMSAAEPPAATPEATPAASQASAALPSTDPTTPPEQTAGPQPAPEGATPGAMAEAPATNAPGRVGEPGASALETSAAEASADPPTSSAAEKLGVAAVEAQLETLAQQLRRAIVANTWDDVPQPLARFYQDMLRPVYSRHDVQAAEVVARAVEVSDMQATATVRVFVQYQQRGRDGLRSVPVPATWIWAAHDGSFRLIAVEAG